MKKLTQDLKVVTRELKKLTKKVEILSTRAVKLEKKQVEKVSLSDLLGKEGKSNADLHQHDEKRRKYHKMYRAPRNRLLHLKGEAYQRGPAADPERDIKYNELVREFVSNGMNKTRAYASVYGVSIKSSRSSDKMAMITAVAQG